MKRVELVVAYDGTDYCGWQIQPNGITIEEVLNKKLTQLLGEPIQVIGASRTDAGVHAEGNRAVFDTETRIPAEKLCFALNQRLPKDIAIQSSREVADDFHPRKQNSHKVYEYRILNRRLPMPTCRRNSYFVYAPLNLAAMQQAATYLIGEHNFKSFCSARTQIQDPVRTIYELSLRREGDLIITRICGNGFLYNMVRIIMGTLLKVGMGIYPPEHMEEILDGRDRALAGQKVPAQGLTLKEIAYEEHLSERICVNNKEMEYELIQGTIKESASAEIRVSRCMAEELPGMVVRNTLYLIRNRAERVRLVLGRAEAEVLQEADERQKERPDDAAFRLMDFIFYPEASVEGNYVFYALAEDYRNLKPQ